MTDKMQVLVLVGGTSAERDVSLASGQAVINALCARGHEVLVVDTACGRRLLDATRPLIPQGIAAAPPSVGGRSSVPDEVVSALALPETRSIGVVFLALHGGDGEDGHIQALLDMARVPYTGSGVIASALAMNKHLTKKIFQSEGVPTPEWMLVNADGRHTPGYAEVLGCLGLPFVVKPNEQGSTVGLTIVKSEEEFSPALAEARRYGPNLLLERYIPGRELTAGVLGEQPLPIVEIIPEHGIYDYECKYTSGKSRYVCPADLSSGQTELLQAIAFKAFTVLGCFGYGRADFRMNERGEPFCLEINTLPGMTSTSLVPKAAAAVGISFGELVERICRLAIIRAEQRQK